MSQGSLMRREPFVLEIYVTGAAGTGSQSGASYDDAKKCATGDLWSIPADTIIEEVFVIVDVAITGSTNIDVGDDDDADGFVDGSGSITYATPGMYGKNAKVAGAYLRVETAGATDAADVYVVPNSKYYSATGKELKLAVTGTWTAGKFRVVVKGYKASYAGGVAA